MQSVTLAFSGVPKFFRISCREASQQREGRDYSNPGYQLMQHVNTLIPHNADSSTEWLEETDQLYQLFDESKIDDAVEWFKSHFPQCMNLIPKRRRCKFIEGAYRRWLFENDYEERFADELFRNRA
ncbi:MAG: hypothetical protein KF851_03200 [Pirellulaceae bacterium]|nr:hypothetical protein [Pirellulaceae bacterium]